MGSIPPPAYPSWLVYILLLCMVFVVFQQIKWFLEYGYFWAMQLRRRWALAIQVEEGRQQQKSPRRGSTRRHRSRSGRRRRPARLDDSDDGYNEDYD